MQQAVFDRGTKVGELARQLYPGGINAGHSLPQHWEEAIRYTSELVARGYPVIYEAGFQYDDVLCFVDILVRVPGGWHAFEVKSSSNLSNVYQLDTALQYYVMKNCGLPLEAIDVVLLNNHYVRSGPLDIQSLFIKHPMTRHAERLQKRVGEKLAELRKVLSRTDVPQVGIGPQCTDPYACDFMGYCWKDIPEGSIFEISGMTGPRKWDLFNQGIVLMSDVPPGYPLTAAQRMQLNARKGGRAVWRKKEIAAFIEGFKFPLNFLDFESFQPAVPLFDRSRPYQQIPFQYSLHILEEDYAEPSHHGFLAEAGEDPRPAFAESLISELHGDGDIVVYNRAFEKRILQDIARDFPEYGRALERLISRMKDLMEPFRQKLIYLPEMNGSYSIKHVLPALVPGYGYSGLPIADGGSASLAYESLSEKEDTAAIAETRQQLLEYCSMDTMAMVKIWRVLKEEC